MVTTDQARSLALALPEAVERDHHGRASFRVEGRIFATLWTPRAMNVMAGSERIRAAVEDRPRACREFLWGERLAAVQVDLDQADAELLECLLDHGWRAKASARLLRDTASEPASEPRSIRTPGSPPSNETAASGGKPSQVDPSRRARLMRDFGLGGDDLADWTASGLAEDGFEDWLTDRVARRPTGPRARRVYGADDVHDFARRAILQALDLGPGDHLLEIGCGGGLLLRDALIYGAEVSGLDHSEDMVDLARQSAPAAEVVLGAAEALPFAQATFTAVAMSIVFVFLPDPVAVLRECHRVLAPGGRAAIYTTSPQLRGTRAAPEPLASRSHFHEDEALVAFARRAAFHGIVVANDHGGQLLTAHR